MNRLNEVIHHPNYESYYNKILELESQRSFCRHNMIHFLDVARIAYILILEDKANIDKEIIYTAAFLHDIGRHEQYLNGEPHERASSRLCVPILRDSSFSEDEIVAIQTAIINHRNPNIKDNKDLSGYLFTADKASRSCHSCLVESSCDWDINKKNMKVTI